MTQDQRIAYLEKIKNRYKKANRKTKAKILDEFCEVCSYNRKYAIRLLHKKRKNPAKKPGKKPIYQHPQLLSALQTIWLASDQMCSKKLYSMISVWLPFYETEYQLLADEIRQKLLSISAASIDRLLKPCRLKNPRKGLSGTKPGTLLKQHIPIKTDNWDINKPGFVESDTVAHCGNSLAGDFVWSLTLTDIHSTWTENRAVWNKGAEGIVKQIKDIETHLPFELLGFDADNGSEFLNHHLWRYFAKRKRPVQFTRSRPYHKNDNAHVEQKNWSHVRQLLGYDRFAHPKIVYLLNDLYSHEYSLFQNYFYPTMKLIQKEKINSKYRKKYDLPLTPYQRLLNCKEVSEDAKKRLFEQHQQLNPFELRRQIEIKLKKIFKLVKVTSNVRQRI